MSVRLGGYIREWQYLKLYVTVVCVKARQYIIYDLSDKFGSHLDFKSKILSFQSDQILYYLRVLVFI